MFENIWKIWLLFHSPISGIWKICLKMYEKYDSWKVFVQFSLLIKESQAIIIVSNDITCYFKMKKIPHTLYKMWSLSWKGDFKRMIQYNQRLLQQEET